MSHSGSGPALAALALGAFVVGTAELVVVGVLHLVAVDLSVTDGSAGWIVTGYALGISIGGPLVGALTARVDRRRVLAAALGCFVVGNVLAATAAGFGMLIAARVLTGTLHGLFVGVASATAASLVPAERRGRAVSMVFGGIAVATVIGVPLGTLIGNTLGWRAAFAGIVIVGAVALAAVAIAVPAVPGGSGTPLRAQVRAVCAPRVPIILVTGLVIIGGQFTAFTYLAPYLERVTGISGGAVGGFLLVYGVASAAGTVLGGRAADRGAWRTMVVGNVVVAGAIAGFAAFGGAPAAAVALLALWGLAGFALVPAFQLRVITLAGPGGDLAATLGASAVNLGIAAGSFTGGLVLTGHGARAVMVVGAVICAAAIPLTAATRVLGVRRGAVAAPTMEQAEPIGG